MFSANLGRTLKEEKMSILDTIKSFLCSLTSDIDSAEKPKEATKVSAPPVVRSKSVKKEAAEVVEKVAEEVSEIAEKVVEEVTEVAEKVAEKAAEVIEEVTEVVEKIVHPAAKARGLQVPEDSTLKRHFLSALQAEIEGDMGPRPTDSSLKRHYDTAVAAEMDNRLS